VTTSAFNFLLLCARSGHFLYLGHRAKIGQTEPCRGSFIEPPKWTFNRPPRRYDCWHPLRCSYPARSLIPSFSFSSLTRSGFSCSEIPSQGVSGSNPSRGTKSERSERPGLGRSKAAGSSQPLGGTHRPHTGSDPEPPPTGTRPTAGDGSGDVPPGAAPRPGSMRSATQDWGARKVVAREPRPEAVLSPRSRSRLGAGPVLRPRPNLPEDPKRGARGTTAPPCAWGTLGAGHAEGGPRAAPSLAGDPAALHRHGGGSRIFLLRLRQVWSRFCRCSPPPTPLSGRGSTPKFKPWRKSERPWRQSRHSSLRTARELTRGAAPWTTW